MRCGIGVQGWEIAMCLHALKFWEAWLIACLLYKGERRVFRTIWSSYAALRLKPMKVGPRRSQTKTIEKPMLVHTGCQPQVSAESIQRISGTPQQFEMSTLTKAYMPVVARRK